MEMNSNIVLSQIWSEVFAGNYKPLAPDLKLAKVSFRSEKNIDHPYGTVEFTVIGENKEVLLSQKCSLEEIDFYRGVVDQTKRPMLHYFVRLEAGERDAVFTSEAFSMLSTSTSFHAKMDEIEIAEKKDILGVVNISDRSYEIMLPQRLFWEEYSDNSIKHYDKLYFTLFLCENKYHVLKRGLQDSYRLFCIRKIESDISDFKRHISIFLQFRPQIEHIYRTNLRIDANGNPDLSKVSGTLQRFLRREHIDIGQSFDLSSAQKYAAKALAEICSQLITSDRPAILPVGIEYEGHVSEALIALGYNAQLTATTGDFGADIIAEKDELRYAIQCKFHAKPAGVKAVQEAESSRKYYKCDFAVVVSRSGFTSAAEELARELRVFLLADQDLARLEAVSVM